MCVNSKKISAWSSACLAQCAAYSTLSSDIFSNQMCGKKKNSPRCSDIWMAGIYRENSTQASQATALQLLCPQIQTHTYEYIFFLLMQNDTKAWQGDKGPVDPNWILKKSLLLFFLGVKDSLYKNKITGALECLGTVPSIMSGTKHIICTLCTTKWVKSQ